MRYDELAEEFLRLGCWQAMNLDGGGSTVLALRDRTTRTYRLFNAPTMATNGQSQMCSE